MKNTIRRSLVAATLTLAALAPLSQTKFMQPAGSTQLAEANLIAIPLSQARHIALPSAKAVLKPVPYRSEQTTKPGTLLKGWLIQIPGGKPLCTPAIYKDKVYIGGGYGSHEFYAFAAETGAMLWQYKTDDDGPTAAVVEDDCVAFNTESCTVYVLNAGSGKLLWKEWLGDPLMSQPAISAGKLFMAYPSGQRAQNIRSGHAGEPGHSLLCADLHTGKHIWQAQISSDVISAPIVESDKVYVTCMDGQSYCFSTKNGSKLWQRNASATSAPVVHNGQLVVAERQGTGKDVSEGMRRISEKGTAQDLKVIASAQAPYLQGSTNGTIGPQSGSFDYIAASIPAKSFSSAGSGAGTGAVTTGHSSAPNGKDTWYSKMDSAVGFSSAPQSAGLDRASKNLGISSVSGAWGYQGARATYRDGAVTNTQLSYVNCIDAQTGKVKWRAQAQAKFITGQSQVFSTPSLGKENMYLCSGDGQIVCMNQKTGAVQYMYATGKPISFQPALSNGSMFIGTSNGELMCVNAGDKDADGWTAWGGNAQHNKAQ